jgi:thiol:disulfide interchange protein
LRGALLIAALSVGVTRALGVESGGWIPFSTQALESAKAKGEVVVLDFTAEWCLNCKALESAVLHRSDVAEALSQPGVAAIKVDITSRASDGWNLLHAYDRVSIPLLVVQRPDGTVTLKSDAYTPEQVLKALEQARAR